MSKSKITTPSKGILKTADKQSDSSNKMSILKLVGVFVILPYAIGILISKQYLSSMKDMFDPLLDKIIPTVQETLISYRILRKKTELFGNTISTSEKDNRLPLDVKKPVGKCYDTFLKAYKRQNPFDKNPFQGISISVHRNGESQPCGVIVESNIANAFIAVMMGKEQYQQDKCTMSLFEDKFMFESLLTEVLQYAVKDTCYSTDEATRNKKSGFYGYCDMGEAKTPILSDHTNLISIQGGTESYLPCHFHDRHGQRISLLSKLLQLTKSTSGTSGKDCTISADGSMVCQNEKNIISNNSTSQDSIDIHLYSVQAGRVFIFAPSSIGEIIPLPHVVGGLSNKPIYMKVLSLEPKVFDILNFFSLHESDELIEGIMKETKETHRIKRSSTGATGYNLNDRRTSESGYDTSSPTALKVKKYV